MRQIEDHKLKEWVEYGEQLLLNRAENEQIGEWIKKCPRLIYVTALDDLSERIKIHSGSFQTNNPHVIIVNKYSFTLEL
jgi:hypothetical protein